MDMVSLRTSLLSSGLAVVCLTSTLVPVAAQAEESYAGNIVGGIAGALLGSRLGGGNGKIAATAAGGVLGAIVGGNMERGSPYRGQYSVPQRTYYDQYPQQVSQYQRTYESVTYPQPVYETPTYERRTYTYAPQQTVYGYAQPSYREWRDADDRREHWEDRGDWHHDRAAYRNDRRYSR
ncbi:MAG: hypothetical protein NVSMB6_26790 [Burkholderiaceae bacterium]